MEDDYVGEAIQKIKLQEQDNEVKLREKRELNAAILVATRGIRDILSHIDKLTKESKKLTASVDKLHQELIVDKTREAVLEHQVQECGKQIEELRKSTDTGITAVWEKRSKLLETTQNVSEKCGFWNLLIKPACKDIPAILPPTNAKAQASRGIKMLQVAKDRKKAAIAERDFLINEPNVGDEFIRIKNAIQYSKEITAKVKH